MMDEMGATKPAGASAPANTRAFGVVVCGAGVAGLRATCKAAEEGLSVACIEKCALSSSGGFNYGFVNTEALASLGARAYDEGEYVADLILRNGGIGKAALCRSSVAANPGAGDWVVGMAREEGHECRLSPRSCSLRIQDQHGMLTAHARKHGAEVLYNTAARQLVIDGDGACTGVLARGVEGDVAFMARRGVVLATGGYAANADYIRRLVPWLDPGAIDMRIPTAAHGALDGDAIDMCERAGLAIGAAPHTPETGWLDAAEGAPFVDGAGERPPDHGDMLGHGHRTRIVMGRPGHRAYRTTDSKEGYPERAVPARKLAACAPYESLEDIADGFGLDRAR